MDSTSLETAASQLSLILFGPMRTVEARFPEPRLRQTRHDNAKPSLPGLTLNFRGWHFAKQVQSLGVTELTASVQLLSAYCMWVFSINRLAFYPECRSLIGYSPHYTVDSE